MFSFTLLVSFSFRDEFSFLFLNKSVSLAVLFFSCRVEWIEVKSSSAQANQELRELQTAFDFN